MNTLPLKVIALGVAMLAGCNSLTGVNDLEVDDGVSGAGGSGTGGTGGGTAGAGGSDPTNCEPEEKPCGDVCVSVNDPAFGCTKTSCGPCPSENAQVVCSDLACKLVECNADWLDCDDKVGCETTVDDGKECTHNECGHANKEAGTTCNQDGGTQCDGNGNCVGCAEHDLRCNGNQPQSCTDQATWDDLAACQTPTPACSDGKCVTVSLVATGDGHSCARLGDGAVRCWGDNARGQLGNGQMGGIERTPVVVIGMHSADHLFAGARHTCVANSLGLHCWGANDDGQIGNDVFGGEQLGPMQVGGLTNVQLTALGSNFTCVYGEFNSTMGVYCWGAASKGQLGNGSLARTYAPTNPAELTGGAVLSLGAGESHVCVVKEPGEVFCWGNNSDGQLGGSPNGQENKPNDVQGVGIASSVAAGGWHTCALTNGGVYCWGADSAGQVGNGLPTALREDPVLVADDSAGFVMITAGGQHTCGVTNDNVLCWGQNSHGQLGIGGLVSQPSPVTLDSTQIGNAVLSAGGAAGPSSTDLPPRGHTCARATDGNVWCWGANDMGQLGTGNTFPSEVPVPVRW